MMKADRIQKLPPYLFAGLEAKAEEMKAKGIDLIDLGIGDPDLLPPQLFTDALQQYLYHPDTHLYPSSVGDLEVRKSIARWIKVRFHIDVDPKNQICVLIGAKEGLANLARAFINPNDKVAVPDPSYPVYANGATILSDGLPIRFPLHEENRMLPKLNDIPDDVKMLYVNYPNNPTGTIASNSFFKELATWGYEHPNTILVQDNAYSELTFNNYQAPALLQYFPNGIEFFSISKMVNATGFRMGFAVGHHEIIQALVKVKTQLDSGAPLFIQFAMKEVLDRYSDDGKPPEFIRDILNVYGERRRVMEEGLSKLGIQFSDSPATFYVWAKVPAGWTDLTFTDAAISKGLIITPGRGFGSQGTNYIRFALTQPVEKIKDALARLQSL